MNNITFGTVRSALMPLLQNKYVLYAVLIIAILNIIGYLAAKNMDAVLFFILVGLLTTYFSRNMIIVLVICIVATNFYIGASRVIYGGGSKEGLENENNDGADDDDADDDAEDDEKETNIEPNTGMKEKNTGMKEKNTGMKEKNTGMKEKNTGMKEKNTGMKEKNTGMKEKNTGMKEKNTGMKEKNTGMKEPNTKMKPKAGMQNLKPASLHDADDNDSDDGGHAKISASKGNRVDYAQTLGQAYDNLQNIIGDEGVQGLTEQTKGLMTQQKVLMDNMKDMEPLLKSAQGFMSQVVGNGGLAGLSKLFDGKLFGAIAPALADNGADDTTASDVSEGK